MAMGDRAPMGPHVVGILLRHGVRNVRQGGLPFFFATLMTALGLFALAMFVTVQLNVGRLTDNIGHQVGAVAFLDVKDARQAEQARAHIALLTGVRAARVITPEEAMSRVTQSLGETGVLLEGAAGVRLPWIVEIAPEPTTQIDMKSLLKAIAQQDGVEEVMHPSRDVERIEAMLKLLDVSGTFLAILIALVVIVVVSNTVKLTLFAQRDEIAIMKLVGATDGFVRGPFLFGGLTQGLLGAALALLLVALTHGAMAGLFEVAIGKTLGAFELAPLPWASAFWILAGGAALGLFGAALSIGRFLKV